MNARAQWTALTPRERDVCRLVAKGHADKQIAAELGTTTSTVQTQRTRAFQRLGLASAAEVVRLMLQVGSVDEPIARKRDIC
jgi:DNA-binding NarL/FixJ family response regulator